MTPLEKIAAWLVPAAQAAELAVRSSLDAEAIGAWQWAFVAAFTLAGWGARNLHEVIFLWQGVEKRLELGKSVLCGLIGAYAVFTLARFLQYPDMAQHLAAAIGAFGGKDIILAIVARVQAAFAAFSGGAPK